MTTFLEELVANINDVDLASVPPPDGEPQEGDVVLGTVPDDAKRVWGLSEQVIKAHNDLAKKGTHLLIDLGDKDARENPELRKIVAEKVILTGKHEVLNSLFFASLRHRFPEAADDANGGIAVRKGWQVVSYKTKSREPFILPIPFPLPFPFPLD